MTIKTNYEGFNLTLPLNEFHTDCHGDLLYYTLFLGDLNTSKTYSNISVSVICLKLTQNSEIHKIYHNHPSAPHEGL